MTPQEYTQQKAAASGSSFYYAFLFLPPERRAAITAFYAYCREIDDVVDEVRRFLVGRAAAAVAAKWFPSYGSDKPVPAEALGWLGWTPDTFWDSTLADLWAGLAGAQEWEHGVETAEARAIAYDRLLAAAEAARRDEQEGQA